MKKIRLFRGDVRLRGLRKTSFVRTILSREFVFAKNMELRTYRLFFFFFIIIILDLKRFGCYGDDDFVIRYFWRANRI